MSASSHLQHHLKKNDALQILRAIAALLVVYTHSIDVVESHAHPRQASFYFLDNFGACGVDIFFAISGFILSSVVLRTRAEGARGALDFIARRFIRIFPIYWIATLFPLLFQLKHHGLTTGWVFSSYLLLPSITYPLQGPIFSLGWTLVFEMFFYYVLSLNFFFGKQRIVERGMLTILLLVGIGSITGFQRPLLILFANPINIEFVMGCAIALLYAQIRHRPALGAALILVGATTLGSTIFLGYREADNMSFVLDGSLSWYRIVRWGLPAAILTAGFVFRPGEVRSAFGRLWVYLGDASYSIYVMSVFTLWLYSRYYRFVSSLPADLNIFLAVVTVALVGAGSYSFIERPMTQFLSDKYRQVGEPRVRSGAW